ncbi:NDP-hexose 2,3-dehydratase family protein [Streptomyces phaeochromogenes]|uniref:NDP-hexose 2,3-dehydratase family protein n=1 Tax=Streptomyces phaeochromogenes TaxID=1923 RepID=A0ABZ1HLU9_STRPH|nr:NDP-hexose 2,3-dehydratase family protein [Streptomyces phaeochromogenes]MCX5598880.1 NDP-hexose 2,3-dehydratase family protein [Streptomyces phaeochromogenes]WSD19588.1 NDP-hexose 2,3-dehydratase family protein [Streptomyces phaeochromogenes]WSJ03604.1 NDP-hexose 2,3-dehydratase family protein [Streptomyces phaeochromogenes]
MADPFSAPPSLKPPDQQTAGRIAARIAESTLSDEGVVTSTEEFHQWFAERRRQDMAQVSKVPLAELSGWRTEPDTGNLVHDTGRFFTVEGVETQMVSDGLPYTWSQPMIHQPEIGILGFLTREFGGVLHFLMQAKNEPGNHNGVQLSPSVQATRSNYTRVHRGNAVPYVEHFQQAERHRVLADVLQSEQGSWFYRKRNRNVVVELEEDVEVGENFCWLTLGQIHRLLATDDVINMDSRTVLACLPFVGASLASAFPLADDLRSAVTRSCSDEQGSLHSTARIRSWLTEMRAETEVRTRRVPLRKVADWQRSEFDIAHEDGRFFRVVGVDVRVGSREVRQWSQPMIEPCGPGVIAFLVTQLDGVLHVLVNARVQGGLVDGIELAPTVQCTPSNYLPGPRPAQLRFLETVLGAGRDRIRFDSLQSEEGGRFHHARNRYLIVELDADHRVEDDSFRWVALHQLAEFLRHSHYVNIEARSLIACLYSLIGATEEVR